MIEVKGQDLGIEDATALVYKIAEMQAHITIVKAILNDSETWSNGSTDNFLDYIRRGMDELIATLDIPLSEFAKISNSVLAEVAAEYAEGGNQIH